jgi:hypothetical protein
MMNAIDEEARGLIMEDRLHRILALVNEWLKFAEAKNAALLAANSAIIFGSLKVLETSPPLPRWLLIYIYLAIVAVALAASLSLLSFLPKTRLPWLGSTKRPTPEDNLLFYGDIACYDPRSFLEALYRQAGTNFSQPDSLEEDYAEQIIINSRIALSKFRFFSLALWITVSALLTPAITIPILLWRRSV